MGETIVRKATAKDDQAIGQILVNAYQTAYSRKMPEVVLPPERITDLLDVGTKRETATVLVCERSGTVIGTVTIFKPDAPQSQAWLENAADLRYLATHVDMHGQGFSKLLLDQAETIARDEWKVDAICLHVRRGAVGVAKIYESRGYIRAPEGDLDRPYVLLDGYTLRFKSTGK